MAPIAMIALVGACKEADKASESTASATAPAVKTTERAATSASSGAAASSSSATPATSGAPADANAWTGKYTSLPGAFDFADNYDKKKYGAWAGDSSDAGLGEGEISIAIDPQTHVVTGTTDGALGPATLAGVVVENRLTAKVTPKNESGAAAFVGTVSGTVTAEKIDGELRVSSLPNASVLRKATFSLTAKR